jgi:hypothetical protein
MATEPEKSNVVEPKHGELEEGTDRRRQVHEAADRSTQQTLNSGMNTGTGDVQRVSDWGTTGKSKRTKKV